jgi:hypothetical protein
VWVDTWESSSFFIPSSPLCVELAHSFFPAGSLVPYFLSFAANERAVPQLVESSEVIGLDMDGYPPKLGSWMCKTPADELSSKGAKLAESLFLTRNPQNKDRN